MNLLEEFNLVSKRIDNSKAIKEKLFPKIETLDSPPEIKENNARLKKSNYTIQEWRQDLSEEEKGLVLALYEYENIIDLVTRFYDTYENMKEAEIKRVENESKNK